MELFAPLDPEEVDELGDRMYLELPQSETARIRKDYQSPTQRKEAYLDLYVHQHPCPTRNDVAEVLFNCANLRQQADLVENTCQRYTRHCIETVGRSNIKINIKVNHPPCVLYKPL